MYLTYDEYLDMGGTVDETAFTRLEYKACKEIDRETFNRVKYGMENEYLSEDDEEAVKECVFQLISIMRNDFSNSENKVINSISNDGVSESYAILRDIKEFRNTIENVIIDYLSNVHLENIPVLYRGADVSIPKMVEW